MKKLLILSLLALLASCRTVRQVETVIVHDTLRTHATDTLRLYRERTIHDTIHLHTERIVTLNAGGDTLRIHTYHHERERIIERDTASRAASHADTIRQSAATIASKETVRRRMPMGLLLIAIAAAAFCAASVTLLVRMK